MRRGGGGSGGEEKVRRGGGGGEEKVKMQYERNGEAVKKCSRDNEKVVTKK